MKKIAKHIYRQRLVIEGHYKAALSAKSIRKYLRDLSYLLRMTIIFGPRVMRNGEKYRPHGQQEGYEGLMVWVESGTSVYTWESCNFFTVDIYSCKRFDAKKAVGFTRYFFKAITLTYKSV